MTFFEPYRERNDRTRPASVDEILIRPALPSDEVDLGEIEAAREGGSAAERAARGITQGSKTGEGFIVVGQHKKRLVGFGKVRYFWPPDEAPPNVAPHGWYLSGLIVVP